MHTALRRGVGVAVAAGGFVLLGFATADTATADTGEGSPGLRPGTTSGLHSPDSGRGDTDRPHDERTTTRDQSPGGDTSGEDGVLSGNQTAVSVCVPVTVDGNQVTVIGDGNHEVGAGPAPACVGHGEAGDGSTSGEDGVGSGNQTEVAVCAPVTVSGNQVTVIGDGNHSEGSGRASSCERSADGDSGDTSGRDGLGSGNRTGVDACVPVTASGNQVTVIGDDNHREGSTHSSSCGGGSGDGTGDTSGEDGIGSGNQTVVDLAVPVDAVGNQLTVIGDGNTNESTQTGPGAGGDAGGSGDGTGDTSGEDGAGSGNQTVISPCVPIDAVGNQLTVIGDGNANESTGPGGGDGSGGGGTGDGDGDTTGEGGTGSGNQTEVAPDVPLKVVDDQVTVIGDDNTNDGSDPGDSDGGDTGGSDGDNGDGDGDGGDGDGGDGDLEVLPGEGLAPGLPGGDLTSATAEATVPGAVDAGLGRTVTDRVTDSPLLPAGLVLLGLLCLGGAVRARHGAHLTSRS